MPRRQRSEEVVVKAGVGFRFGLQGRAYSRMRSWVSRTGPDLPWRVDKQVSDFASMQKIRQRQFGHA